MTDGPSAGEERTSLEPPPVRARHAMPAWLVALSVVAGGAVLAGLGWTYYFYAYLNDVARAEAKQACASDGPVEVLDERRWRELVSRSQPERLAAKGRYDIQFPSFSLVQLHKGSRVWLSTGTGYNHGQPVVRLKNPQVFARTIASDVGLTPRGPSFDCLLSTPSPARSLLIGW